MYWAMNIKNHTFVVPNSTVIYPWESDLISVTRAMFVHEYEIKISKADYCKDKKKVWKHMHLQNQFSYRPTPNYFWYATYNFDIEPPSHAGWIKIIDHDYWPKVNIMKPAPLLHKCKLEADKIISISTLLSFRLTNIYKNYVKTEVTP